MKVALLYHPNTEHEAIVRDFIYNYKRQSSKEMPLVSLDTREGADMAKLYGVTAYPAIVAIKDDGQLLKLWEGEPLPIVSEVSFYDQTSLKSN